ncbi:unnamed protein product [Phaedon cochleariae]|uniref:Uncharacterized protein n=1 Tax=Phaedon cochleariae TaxID=80249 RepID=A0A9P0DJ59_PHACE|nr:unnamed protein product [Phaedon cochleariae]
MVTKSILKGSSNIPDGFRQIHPETFSRKTKSQKKIKQIGSPGTSHISENLSSLAEPKKRPIVNMDDSHWKVKNSTLKYKATKRIRSLARPKAVTPKCRELVGTANTSISSVSPSALKYQPTSRIIELARPKDWMYYEKYE